MKRESSRTLNGLIEKNVMKYGETISAVVVSTQQEAVLEEMLKKVTDAWANTEFEVKPNKVAKDGFVLGSVEEVTAKLDDSIVTINTIMGSRFIGAIQEEVLAPSKNPRAVQSHLLKCFENLVKLDFGDVPGSVGMIAMYSSENEKVPLGKSLKAPGNVEV
ncbi:Dynein heavy chain [Phytophthora megakarya]|uniref:Dynein heavy chain n=1 Tax=Phytophthora megakarya TaxID=4795 RepID=A0A225WMA6_9STRA|nr:Dynein heavy chain [Phytophthora megakarya]